MGGWGWEVIAYFYAIRIDTILCVVHIHPNGGAETSRPIPPDQDGDTPVTTPHIGKKVILRTYASGVHFGTLVAQDGRQVELHNSRRLWRWHTGGKGISLSEVATSGIDQSRSRIAVSLPEITILDALEIIPATDEAAVSIEGAEVAK